MRSKLVLSSILLFGAGFVAGWFAPSFLHAAPDQPYAGEETRQIASLSREDVRALLAGEGWGLAKPAELNGYPGPSHVLELRKELELSETQEDAINEAFDKMNAKARELGQSLVEAETALDAAFEESSINQESLQEHLRRAEEIRAALRSVHLSAHLHVTPILSQAQRSKYAQLRGYGAEHQSHSGH